MKKNCIRITMSNKKYGGNFYESCIDAQIQKETDLDYAVLRLNFNLKGLWRVLEVPFLLTKAMRVYFLDSLIIVNYLTIPFLPFLRHSITILHHIDDTATALPIKLFLKFNEFIFKKFYSRTNTIVVVSKYWEDEVRKLGFTDVVCIYNPFDISLYNGITDTEVAIFLEKYNLNKNNYIYIGNPRPEKGYPQVAATLQESGLTLVSSGEGTPAAYIKHLDLESREYLCLIKGAMCTVTMSIFKEGWCRVAHESMLLGCPVVGSGLGGMGELIRGGGGEICQNFAELKESIKKASIGMNKKAMFEYAKTFDMDRFSSAWQNLIKNRV